MKFPRFIGIRGEGVSLEFCSKGEGEGKKSREVFTDCEGKGRGVGHDRRGLFVVLNNCYLDGKLTKSARQLGLLAPPPSLSFPPPCAATEKATN